MKIPVNEEDRVLVTGHVAPDGDSVSSGIALALRYDGAFHTADKLPETLEWLEEYTGIDILSTKKAVRYKPDAIIVVDCAPTEERTGFPIEEYTREHPDTKIINIDHHADRATEKTDYEFIIDPEASSTAEILVNHGLRDPILYIGMATDTGNFEYSHPNRAMKAVIELDLSDETIDMYRKKSRVRLDIDQFRAIQEADIRLLQASGRSLFVVELPVSDSQVNWSILNLARGFDYVAIRQDNGRVSLRTTVDGADLSKLASKFGGGGHAKASGCQIEYMWKLIEELTRFIEEVEEDADENNR